ncbi:hypothetical protein BFV94_4526 [Alteromonas macleodii]|uniref:Uncharacterized protein n=2 Tax=Alteromonas macleodii TaxID=28108 RepID=A0AB36FL53_ALTMA|nr:hypothetical protein BFV93_4743 [Alteromonas macleodii]OES24777.1 hypothetical protein BFV95_4536 [Alteromonas macleodii]OES25055.1 hypothetical protein BFV94_4526 [Alteromonas macleodii]OES39098.1 hypothetical protein BFV96_4246 [Alteromonas macleodii]
MCGQTVEVVHVHGNNTVERFCGFKSFASMMRGKSCVLTEIQAFSQSDDLVYPAWRWFHRNDWLLGERSTEGVYLITMEDGMPLVVNAYDVSRDPYNQSTKDKPNNVHNFERRRA